MKSVSEGHRKRQVRYAVRRRLCWKCFRSLYQSQRSYQFFCECGFAINAQLQFEYEQTYGRAVESTLAAMPVTGE